MAKTTGLGKGLDALMGAPAGSKATGLGGNASAESIIKKTTTKASNIPEQITVDDNGTLWIDPKLLKPNPKQPRTDFDQEALEELAASIKINGVLEPIIIEQYDPTTFYIIAGERRTRASLIAGVDKVPVSLRKYDDFKKLEVALIENIQRADLNPIEEAQAYYNLIQLGDLNQDEVAKRVGKNRSTVANAIRLLKLPEDMQQALVSGILTAGHARAILSVKNDADRRVLFEKIKNNGVSVREAENLAETYNNGGRAAKKDDPKKKTTKKDADIQHFEQEVKNVFGIKNVNLKGTMEKGVLEIEYTSRADLDRIYNVIIGSK
ncbi:MAG: ParB/RepB/Spo0J family partition protein [Treponema sp.]|nr:ParB/RepB/Spo0J family partition protein [Treponema sp.]